MGLIDPVCEQSPLSATGSVDLGGQEARREATTSKRWRRVKAKQRAPEQGAALCSGGISHICYGLDRTRKTDRAAWGLRGERSEDLGRAAVERRKAI